GGWKATGRGAQKEKGGACFPPLAPPQQGEEPPAHGGRRAREPVGDSCDLLAGRWPFDFEPLPTHLGKERGIAHRRIKGAPQDLKPSGRNAGRREIGPRNLVTYVQNVDHLPLGVVAREIAQQRHIGKLAMLALPCCTMMRTSFFASQSV